MTCKQRDLQMFTKNRKVYLGIQCKAQLMCTLSLPSSTGRVQTRETNMFFLPVTYICHISSLQLKQLKRLLSTDCRLQWCSNTTSLLCMEEKLEFSFFANFCFLTDLSCTMKWAC